MFVTLVMILQRLDRKMWGLSQVASEVVERSSNGPVELKTECRGQFELIGRRTYCASIIPKRESDGEGEVTPTSLFLKSNWAEERQELKEPDIIRIAHDRAFKLLPEKYREMVTHHIPTVITSGECVAETTSIIRLLMKKAGGIEEMSIEDIQNQARVQVVFVTEKLQAAEDLEPVDFWQVFWDVVRCKLDTNSNQFKNLVSDIPQVTSFSGRLVLPIVI